MRWDVGWKERKDPYEKKRGPHGKMGKEIVVVRNWGNGFLK